MIGTTHSLTFTSPSGAQKIIPLSKERTTIGRNSSCDIYIDAPGIFPIHATLVRSLQDLFIIAHEHAQSIDVNGFKQRRHSLLDADTFHIANFSFTISRLSPASLNVSPLEQDVIDTLHFIDQLPSTNHKSSSDSKLDLPTFNQTFETPSFEKNSIPSPSQSNLSTATSTPLELTTSNLPPTLSDSTSLDPLPSSDSLEQLPSQSNAPLNIDPIRSPEFLSMDSDPLVTLTHPAVPHLSTQNISKHALNLQQNLNNSKKSSINSNQWGHLKGISGPFEHVEHHFSESLIILSIEKTKILFSLRDQTVYLTWLEGPFPIVQRKKCSGTISIKNKELIAFSQSIFKFESVFLS